MKGSSGHMITTQEHGTGQSKTNAGRSLKQGVETIRLRATSFLCRGFILILLFVARCLRRVLLMISQSVKDVVIRARTGPPT